MREFGKDISTIRSQAELAQTNIEQTIAAMDLQVQVIAKTSTLISSLVVNGNEKDVERLLNNPQVEEIYPVYDYELSVADSADYMMATPLVENGLATKSSKFVTKEIMHAEDINRRLLV